MASFPLIARPAGAALFLTQAGPIDAGRFLADAAGIAGRLPAGEYILNVCRDRYRFAATLAAGLLAGRVSLLCGDPSASVVAGLVERFAGTVVIGDAEAEGAPGEAVPLPKLSGDRLVTIVFTSGSTGVPVAHPKSWAALVARSRAAGERFGFAEAEPSAIVGTVPPGHMYGLETTVLLPFHAACAAWCGPAFFAADVQAALEAVPGPRVLVTTPLQLRNLAGLTPPTLQAVVSATAPLDGALARAVEARWGSPVFEIFGATECGSVATRRTAETERWRPYDGVSLHEAEAGPVVRGAFAPDVPLADAVEIAEDGSFRLLGRRTDLVKMGGRRASLAGLNEILTGLEGVRDGVFVVPDDLESRSTARLVAVVVAPGRTLAGLLAELRERIDPVFLPRRLIQVEALPRNNLGKLPREALLQLVRTRDTA